MRAVRITAPNEATVLDRPDPQAGPGEVLIRIERAGLCGTDVALFRGTMPYLGDGRTTLPLQPGHEWAGRVVSVGDGVTGAAPGDLVTGDTFIGCGVCTLCTTGRHQLDGALAERLVVPERAVHRLPDGVDADLGAMVEPASCSLRGVRLTAVGPGDRVLVWGAGTLGMFASLFAADTGASVAVAARRGSDRNFVAGFGLETRDPADLGDERFDVIIEATGSAEVTRRLLDNATAGARIALLGVPGGDVGLPSGRLIALDATVHAVLGGSADIDEAARRFATMGDTVRRLIGSVITLDEVPRVLAEGLPRAAGTGPKTQICF
jgi:2-desacetyl-2-hydroxyethyl bacteriochlorophyllide A dehydrogenase